MNRFVIILLLFVSAYVKAQQGAIHGRITYLSTSKPVAGVAVVLKGTDKKTVSNDSGFYRINGIANGSYVIEFSVDGMQKLEENIVVNGGELTLHAELVLISGKLNEVEIISGKDKTNGMGRLSGVDGFAIYEAKKNELIILKELNANLATNNARQVFGKVPGLNIWESDGAGLQLGVGGRGLSPNRTSNFNTRQNGYDISADALGYPESYYTPPVEALEKVEVVRGAASLQYGTQFGGMMNFVFKKGPADKKIEVNTRQTIGSFGFFGSFNSIGGTVARGKLNYYTFFNHKQGNGWRPNSGFEVNTVYGAIIYSPGSRFSLNADYTWMGYNARQPGGMTDAQFEDNPRRSFRQRNWFKVNWNLFALTAEYKFSQHTRINIRNFGLISARHSLGNLERINVADLGGNRTLIQGDFTNAGNEIRLLHHYKLWNKPSTLLIGSRVYYGVTRSIQGDAGNGSDASYELNNPDDPEGSDYQFTNRNFAFFAENVFRLNSKWSITPGVRWEYINTASEGHYKIQTRDFAGNVVADTNIYGDQKSVRSFMLAGIGVSFKMNRYVEFYGNISQNYRAVNFNDLRIINPNSVVDPGMKDESGYSADLGLRGNYHGLLNYDLTCFLLSYNDRIGQVLRADQPPLYQDYRFRTNIADSRNTGVECFVEADVWKMITTRNSKNSLLLFANLAYVDARYIHANDKAIENKNVEMAPPFMMRNGITYKREGFSITLQGNYVAAHYTDATNAKRVAGAVNGIIPAYQVFDVSFGYTYKRYRIEGSCNNMFDQMYFTRRADSYPGPGIIPADGRSVFITLAVRI